MSIAQEVCRTFLGEVVERHVFSEAELTRGEGPLDDVRRRDVQRGVREDVRSPFLATISGKGGWVPDEGRREAYAVFTNVTLLDHSISVVRGALVFAELDLHASRPRTEDELRRRLAAVAAIAFLHDADKMLEQERSVRLTAEAVGALMQRFGIDVFLAAHGVGLTPAQMLVLIDSVETGRFGSLHAVPREQLHDRIYVRLADRLDGILLKTRSTEPDESVGVDGVLREIGRFEGLDTPAVRLDGAGGWRVVTLRDPHTPFLLDAFQAALSVACQERHGMPPLIELHHDGRLLVMLPQEDSDALIEQALARATRPLGARIRIATNDRGKVALLDAPGTLDDLRASVEVMPADALEKVLRGSTSAVRAHAPAIDALLRPVAFLPRTPDLAAHAAGLVKIWTGTADVDEDFAATHRDGVTINAVLSCADPPARLGIPDAGRREAELRTLLTEHGAVPDWPAWFDAVPSDTRRALLAGLAAGAARRDEALSEALLGPAGLVALWLEGRNGRPGLASSIDSAGLRLRAAVQAHYSCLLAGRLVEADEALEGRCHFTNAPVPREARVDGRMGLYGVNVSAFSGREGRPEGFRSAQAETLVSPIAEAEHRLRRLQFEAGGRLSGGRRSPLRITSPTTAGLFGALPFANQADATEYALADLLRTTIEPGRLTYHAAEAPLRRVRVARFEEMPARLTGSGAEPGQISLVAMAFKAAQRTGRPLHLFRGLPHPRPEFVAFDTLPQPLEALLGGTGFRLEQIPGCLKRLRGVEAVAEATGFGPELALRLCDPMTRFGGACDALARVERRLAAGDKDPALSAIQAFSTALLLENTSMSSEDRAIVAFGEAMARAQRKPLPSNGDNVIELGLRTALDTVEALSRMGQTADESLVAGIAGEIGKELVRRNLAARRELRDKRPLSEAVTQAANVFVGTVWRGAFSSVAPASRDRRVALAVYRHAFQQESRRLYASTGAEAEMDEEGNDQD